MLEAKLREDFIHEWIIKKQKTTFIQIDPEWQNCEFEFPGWVH
jgi:peptidyl-prolyl cis-trans isomerase SurA